MYVLATLLLLVALVAMLGAALFLGSVMVVLLQTGSQAIARAIQRHARSVANVQLQPKESAVQTRLRA